MMNLSSKIRLNIFLLLMFPVTISYAQPPPRQNMEKWSSAEVRSALLHLKEFLSIPNNAVFPEHVENNVQWCKNTFEKHGFEIQTLETEGPPALLAKQNFDPTAETVLFYLQIDGQPVDTSEWNQSSPYKPVLKAQQDEGWEILPWEILDDQWNDNWRIFARSASDAKGPVIMFLTALEIIKKQNLTIPYNIKVIMDFEEELGSPHLPGAVNKYQSELAADKFVILDGPLHVTNRPTLTFGARGIATITLTIFGPRKPQHSGHYGNYLQNPALKLAYLLSSMKDEKGRVVIPGFYEGIKLTEKTKSELAKVPDNEAELKKLMGVAETDQVAPTLQESIQYPSLNIRGMASGWVGKEVRTIIPDRAIAEIDVRIVKESDPERLIGLIRDHIEARGYHFVKDEPTEEERQKFPDLIDFKYRIAYQAFRTPIDSPIGNWLTKALNRAHEKDLVRKRTSGGSIPISPFVTTLNVPAVTVPTVNPDNNQHSPNENLRLGNLKDGIKTCISILTQPIEE